MSKKIKALEERIDKLERRSEVVVSADTKKLILTHKAYKVGISGDDTIYFEKQPNYDYICVWGIKGFTYYYQDKEVKPNIILKI